ncbi:hypothetical protein [Megasphaera hominis]|jgi:hypothetical protein|uniref:Uncharacterized protein n=1 Tax=Megasphaera hominis TaxID=159836 RepID=A0ABR6VKM9_9FIRM|nr:hypothetical protein [Megasphaera hominis]MBC3537307.1 hypothetical protein [Megasphaera hominis]
MDTYIITDLTGSDGYFTFNFFCESIVSALHTLVHLMEDEKLEVPEKVASLPPLLAHIGEDLTADYEKATIDMHRFKENILDFYETAFAVNDDLAPLILKGSDHLRYYYYVYAQGVNIMLRSMLENIVRDFPAQTDPRPYIEEIMTDFSKQLSNH